MNLCNLGFHSYVPVAEFGCCPVIFGLECKRCKRRRVSLFGNTNFALPVVRSADASIKAAQQWASKDGRGITPSAFKVWWK